MWHGCDIAPLNPVLVFGEALLACLGEQMAYMDLYRLWMRHFSMELQMVVSLLLYFRPMD
jgi:hypothetical protein